MKIFNRRKEQKKEAAADNRHYVSYISSEKYNDSEPGDTTFECVLIYLLRAGGRLKIAQDRFLMGIFSETTWVRLLKAAGFRVIRERFRHSTFRKNQYLPMYVCIKPKGNRSAAPAA